MSARIEWTGNIQVHHPVKDDGGRSTDPQLDLLDYVYRDED